MTFSVDTAPETVELTLLNRVLLMSGLRPASSLGSVQPGSDAYYAHFWLNDVFRREMEKGWYLWNKADCEEFTIGPFGLLTVPPAHRVEVSRETFRKFPDFPHALRQIPGGSTEALTLAAQQKLVELTGQTIYLDVVYRRSPFSGGTRNAPEVLMNYCAVKAASEFAPQVGGVIPKEVIQEAYDQLLRAEAAVTPRSNVFMDEPGTLLTWADR